MSIASVAEEKYPKIEEDTLPQVDESDKIINEMRRKQIARLKIALQAVLEIRKKETVIQTKKHGAHSSLRNRQKIAKSMLSAERRQTVLSLEGRRQQGLKAQEQKPKKRSLLITVYER